MLFNVKIISRYIRRKNGYKMEESFLSILLYFSLLHDLFSMFCWCSNGVLLPLKVSMFTEFVFNFGSCLSLKIYKCRNSPVCLVSPKMD